jgi:hypothetical protein
MVPRKEMEKELKDQEKELSDDITNLTKKVGIALSPSLPSHRCNSQNISRNNSMMRRLSYEILCVYHSPLKGVV